MNNMDEMYQNNDGELSFVSDERMKEINAILKKSFEDLKKNGLEGFLTFDEFTDRVNEKLGGRDHV